MLSLKQEKKPIETIVTWAIILFAVFAMIYGTVHSSNSEPVNPYSNAKEDPRR